MNVFARDFASVTPPGPTEGGTHHDAQGHMIQVHGTRSVYISLGREGNCQGAEYRVTNVRTPIVSMGELVKQGYRFEAGPTGCKISKRDRGVTVEVVRDVKACTTGEGARNADARLVAAVVIELHVELSSSSSPTTPSLWTARALRGSSAEHLDSSSPVEDTRTRLRELRAPVWGTKNTDVTSRAGERKVLNVDTCKTKLCWTDDDVTWRVRLTQPYRRP